VLVDSNQSAYATNGIPDGDLTPWRVRLELVNTGEDGVDNSGNIKLRIDEKKTFIKTGALFLEEDAKKKYLIEAKITQTINGTSTDSKTYRFQIGTPSISVDPSHGAMLTIQLQEIQRRTQEVFSSRELRFLTPKQALQERVFDFNYFEGFIPYADDNEQVTISFTGSKSATPPTWSNKLPESPEMEYVPQSPVSIKSHLDSLFRNLTESQAVGGTMTDFYYDYDPDPVTPLVANITCDAIGRVDTGCVLNPLSAEAIDSEMSQDTNTDFFQFRNHIIGRGAPNAGSLPMEHSRYSSDWLHAQVRKEWSATNSVYDRRGNSFKYLRGHTVKVTNTLVAFDSQDQRPIMQRVIPEVKLIRFFQAMNNVTSATSPETNHTDWQEDFLLYPEFSKTGHYQAGDIVYYNIGSSSQKQYRFYQANQDIYDWSLNRYRNWEDSNGGDGNYPANDFAESLKTTKHLNDSTGFLYYPTQASGGWWGKQAVTPDHSVSTHSTWSSFVDFTGFSPWTADVFDWEKNMCGIPENITDRLLVPYGETSGKKNNTTGVRTSNRYVGLVPDWNMTKDVYEVQDVTDQFENITMKWVTSIRNSPPSSKYIYHGARYMVGENPPATYGSPSVANPFAGKANRLAQYVWNAEEPTESKWHFSRAPIDGDTFQNLEDARVYQYNNAQSEYEVYWKIVRATTTDLKNVKYGDAATPFHLVKDVYKVRGFDGTPNSGIEFRYAWDQGSGSKLRAESEVNGKRNDTLGLYGSVNSNKESIACRLNSRGAWTWFWFPFPRESHSDVETVDVGEKYGGNGDSPQPKTGYTTLNIYNNTSDRTQSEKGWNNGLFSEDMGKINSISFRIKVGIYALPVASSNDDYFWEIPDYFRVIGEANIPMTFWCLDMFDRVWTHKFTVRKNGYWDQITIPVLDMNMKNMHIPRFDELRHFGIRPLGFTNFALPQKEFTGVAFDWRFVKGWGIQLDAAYDKENGYYHGGFDYWLDTLAQFAEQIKQTGWNGAMLLSKGLGLGDKSTYINHQFPAAFAVHNQATIALDDVHWDKELIANSSDTMVKNARTSVMTSGNIADYITLKSVTKSAKERLSFYPQYWNLRSIGDVRMRIGQSFRVKGDRMPNMVDMDGVTVWSNGTSYAEGAKVSYDGYVWQSLQNSNSNKTPDTSQNEDVWWENLNRLSCYEVRHIIDHTGYHMIVGGRRKFILQGDTEQD